MVSAGRIGQQHHKKQRKIGYLPDNERYYIFCEGECTEPNYFQAFKKAIESDPIYKNRVTIKIEGLGAQRMKVLEAAQAYIASENPPSARVWCVYDRDPDPGKPNIDRDFNAVSQKAAALSLAQQNITYNVAWSNQCFEYWFILHFDYYVTDNDRQYYISYLKDKFKQFGLPPYKKNEPGTFNILLNYGNPKQAISLAKKRLSECEAAALTDAQSAPATRVHLLVEELACYLPEELRSRFIDKIPDIDV